MAAEMKVTLTLPIEAGRRLQKMCRARRMTASSMIEVWISERDDKGERKGALQAFLDSMRGDSR